MPYPKDDDWGDWAHEQRKQKALDKRWVEEDLALRHDLAHRDFDAELARAFATTYSDCSDTCQRCGRKDRGTGCNCSTEVLP